MRVRVMKIKFPVKRGFMNSARLCIRRKTKNVKILIKGEEEMGRRVKFGRNKRSE